MSVLFEGSKYHTHSEGVFIGIIGSYKVDNSRHNHINSCKPPSMVILEKG